MKINILDPGLLSVIGHSHDWDIRIANRLVALGHEVSVYAHVHAHPAALLGFDGAVRVEPMFVHNPYSVASEFDPICGEIERQFVGARKVSRDLKKVDPADLWLWPTAFAHQLRGCAMVDTDARISACFLIPPNDGLGIPFAETGEWWRISAKALRAAGHRTLTMGTVEAEGLPAFQHFMGELDPVRLPTPVDGRPSRRTELTTVGIFGAQRDDQGRLVVGRVIARCLQAGFKVLTQTDKMLPEALKDHPGLTLLGYDGDFPSKIERSDLVVAPYRWDLYSGGRGSGIISQAIASGIPCVAPYRSSPGRALARIGSAVLFSELRAAAVFDAILHAQKTYPVLAEAAFRGAEEWREQNGIAKFVDVMINGSPKATLADRPSSVARTHPIIHTLFTVHILRKSGSIRAYRASENQGS